MKIEGRLYPAAKKYVEIIEKTERAAEPLNLYLHERRVTLHWQWVDLLEREGIRFRDRDHAMELAYKIARRLI